MSRHCFRRFQVYGQRCSGTNALIKLLEQNLEDLHFTEDYGFKHWLLPAQIEIPDDVFVIVIARRPDHWLRSLHATPWHAHPDLKAMDFSEFIRSEWRTVWDEDFWGMDSQHPNFGRPITQEMCPEARAPFCNPIAMRTAKLQNWVSTASRARGHLLINHAELVADPRGVLLRIACASQTRTRDAMKPVSSYKGHGKKPFRISTYQELSEEDLLHVSRHISPEIEEKFRVPVKGFGTTAA